ncbi:MAG: S8 family serine peptidase, partial [Candidatus Cloacimonetes bacterium]|nr:S8 family serine peptidase [Candidatus Cloacimonadota bacterium]
MRTTILVVTLILLSLALSAMEPQKGERPFIDIYQVPDSAIETGRIKIKLDAKLLSYVQSLPIVEGKLTSFGLPALDDLNQLYKIKEITQLFYSPALSKSFSWRHSEWGFPLWFELRFEPTASLRDMVMAYRELKDLVQWAEPEYKKRLVADNASAIRLDPNDQSRWSSNDPMLSNQWHYNNTGQNSGTPGADIRLFNAWDIEKGNTSVIVAIIDGGIQITHPDLAANIWSGVGYNFVYNSSTIVAHDHGTHVSGTVAAVTNNSVGVAGVAGGNGTQAGVRLMSCQVFTDTNSDGFHLAPVYAADNGAAISQNSWGYTSVGVYDQNVLDAIDYFNTHGGGTVMNGGITIFAAGNDGSEGLWYPGCYNGAFSVAGTTNQDTKAYYSNYGTWVDVSAPGGETISVSARGVLSTLTGGTYGYYQGTSMACPHVSGIAALALSYTSRNGTTISNTQLANALLAGTDDHYAQNSAYLGKLGTGRMNTVSVLNAFTPGMPSCQITAPATGGIYDVGTQIAISVSASDSDGSISRVEFFLNDVSTPAYTDNSFPYGWTWNTSGLSTGSYAITAKAFDNDGNQASDQISLGLLGIADEGFESGNFSAYNWTHSGSQSWVVQSAQSYAGQYAAKSGTINHNQQSSLSVSLQISSPGNISFFKKVSSESGYDFLMFYIDGVEMGSWSGVVDWAFHSYAVSSGYRTFTWTYTKDVSLSSNSDCAWLDHISFPSHSQYYAPPLAFTATPGNQMVTLSWQAPESGAPTGYKIFKNGSLLSTISTTSYLDQAVSNGTTYSYYVKAVYASGESEATQTVYATPQEVSLVDVILGSGTSTTGTQDGSPVNVYYKSLHGQAIYTAAELNAAGVYGPINITALGFFVVSAPIYALPNFVIRLKHCSDTNVLSWQSETGLVTVYSSASFSPQTGSYQMLQFSTPFTWNGVDNLVVDTGFGLLTNYSSSGTIRYTSVSNGYRFIRDDNSNMTSTFTGGSISSYRPNIKFNLESIPT